MTATEQTLLLSQSYEPVKVISWQRAITLLFLRKVEVLEEYDRGVKCTSFLIKVPAVVRLLKAFRRHSKTVKFSRVNIYGRDDYRCQYCSRAVGLDELTYDHVLPRSRGGKTEWTNIVTSCTDCNSRKADRTPAEARMKLRKVPVMPTVAPAIVLQVSRKSAPDAWRDYMYWTGSLDV